MRPVPTQPSRLPLKSKSGIFAPCKRLHTSGGRVKLARLTRHPGRAIVCNMALHTYGTMAVDWEERVRFDCLREERLARISSLLAESELGALLCFDMTNIRYITATHIGTWE